MVKKNVCLNRCGVNVACSTRVQLYRGLESRWSQTKDYIINICCFAAENTALRSNSKDLLVRPESEYVRMERHVCQRTVVSVS